MRAHQCFGPMRARVVERCGQRRGCAPRPQISSSGTSAHSQATRVSSSHDFIVKHDPILIRPTCGAGLPKLSALISPMRAIRSGVISDMNIRLRCRCASPSSALDTALAEERFLEAARSDAAAFETGFVVEQLGGCGACHADASSRRRQASLEEIGVQFAAALGNVSVGVAKERQRVVEVLVARNFGHG